jgi:rod shape-determining protein MreC
VISIFEKSDSSNRIVRMKLYSDLSTINQLFVVQRGDELWVFT